METRTHTTYFDTEKVDEIIGGAYKAFESEWEGRKEFVTDPRLRSAIEARLGLLRHTWAVMLERVPE